MSAAEDAVIRDILESVKVIALLGASPNPARPSHGVMRFLLEQGYRVIPVNPGQAGKEILGQPCVAGLADIAEPIDMVDVFRAGDALPGIVEDAMALSPRPTVIWTQLGVRHAEAEAKATTEGFTVVAGRCPAIEIPRLGIGAR
ncbi:CoA-binding protein [Aureimonas sp. SA4125]|uniref:CoA-binding protein n=1 Tax=Aureimonas sp. SA4125 TaxID=2826993 RepID=UPI001CC780FC|nr:CoA-binding protein [Aureimonas sp. SA4125]BDA84098.1 CoA-binding protein [Aureimonas sp. SA4125]